MIDTNTLIAKLLGMIFALGSGYSPGRIGPDIHIGAMIGYNLLKLDIFSELKKDEILKYESILIGAATGLTITFGTPLTGLIGAIELTG